jgi:O-antigen/teichoic acid export membrane protein
MAAGKNQLSAAILLALIPLALLFNLSFIPSFGPTGAAVSLALTIATGTAIGGMLVYRYLGCLIQLSTVMRVTGATLLMAFASTQLTTTGPWLILKFVVLLALYGLFLGIFKETNWGEVKALAYGIRKR